MAAAIDFSFLRCDFGTRTSFDKRSDNYLVVPVRLDEESHDKNSTMDKISTKFAIFAFRRLREQYGSLM